MTKYISQATIILTIDHAKLNDFIWFFIQFKAIVFIMKVVIALILLSAVLSTVSSKKLVFIECITRHGVRYPSFPNPYDFSNISESQHSKSELTNQGRHMHFVLGRLLYKKYWNELFPNTTQTKFNNSLIYAKSTNTNRTIESLQNLLLGFFAQLQNDQIHFNQSAETTPPFKSSLPDDLENQWNEFWLKQKTIPIHVEKGAEGDPGIANSFNEGDFLVKQEYNLCPNQISWEQQNLNSPIVTKIMGSPGMQKAVESLHLYFKDIPLDFNNLYKIVDNYNCLKAMGRPYLPIFQDEEIQTYLQFARLARLYVVYLNTQQQIKTYAHTLLATTIYNFRRAAEKKGPNLVFYSGHDITIAILLTALNLTNINCLFQSYIQKKAVANCYLEYPHFASSFVFQLWQEDGSYSVKISINGQSYKLPICNYSQACKLEEFQSWFKGNTIQNSPNQECGVPSVKSQKIYIQMALVFSLGVAIPFVLYFCFSNKKKNEETHSTNSSLNMDDDFE